MAVSIFGPFPSWALEFPAAPLPYLLPLFALSATAFSLVRLFYFKCDDEDSVEQWTTFIKKALGA